MTTLFINETGSQCLKVFAAGVGAITSADTITTQQQQQDTSMMMMVEPLDPPSASPLSLPLPLAPARPSLPLPPLLRPSGRASNQQRIKLSRELMLKLSAALSATSNHHHHHLMQDTKQRIQSSQIEEDEEDEDETNSMVSSTIKHSKLVVANQRIITIDANKPAVHRDDDGDSFNNRNWAKNSIIEPLNFLGHQYKQQSFEVCKIKSKCVRENSPKFAIRLASISASTQAATTTTATTTDSTSTKNSAANIFADCTVGSRKYLKTKTRTTTSILRQYMQQRIGRRNGCCYCCRYRPKKYTLFGVCRSRRTSKHQHQQLRRIKQRIRIIRRSSSNSSCCSRHVKSTHPLASSRDSAVVARRRISGCCHCNTCEKQWASNCNMSSTPKRMKMMMQTTKQSKLAESKFKSDMTSGCHCSVVEAQIAEAAKVKVEAEAEAEEACEEVKANQCCRQTIDCGLDKDDDDQIDRHLLVQCLTRQRHQIQQKEAVDDDGDDEESHLTTAIVASTSTSASGGAAAANRETFTLASIGGHKTRICSSKTTSTNSNKNSCKKNFRNNNNNNISSNRCRQEQEREKEREPEREQQQHHHHHHHHQHQHSTFTCESNSNKSKREPHNFSVISSSSASSSLLRPLKRTALIWPRQTTATATTTAINQSSSKKPRRELKTALGEEKQKQQNRDSLTQSPLPLPPTATTETETKTTTLKECRCTCEVGVARPQKQPKRSGSSSNGHGIHHGSGSSSSSSSRRRSSSSSNSSLSYWRPAGGFLMISLFVCCLLSGSSSSNLSSSSISSSSSSESNDVAVGSGDSGGGGSNGQNTDMDTTAGLSASYHHSPSSSSSSSAAAASYSTSDELHRAVLATMGTGQSPGYLPSQSDYPANESSNSLLDTTQPFSTSIENQDNINSSVSSSPTILDRFLDFGRIFIMSAIIVGDICGNSLVILSVCRHTKLRVTTNWFVVSLACADILVALFAMTFNASVIISGRWLFKGWVCDFWNSCDVLASTASILHLCCISIDRYIAIMRPLDYPMKITTRRVMYALCGVWISSALLSYIPIFTGIYTTAEHIEWLRKNPDQCDFVVNRVYAIVSSSISFWIPCCIMVFTYYRIYREATRQEKFIYNAQKIMPAPQPNHHHHHHSNSKSSSSNSAAHQRNRRSKSVAAPSVSAGTTDQQARIRHLAKQQLEQQKVTTTELNSGSSLTVTASDRAGSLQQLPQDNQPLKVVDQQQQTDLNNNNNNEDGAIMNKTGSVNFANKQQQLQLAVSNTNNNNEADEEDDEPESNSGQSTPTKRSISKMKREHKAAKTLGIIMGVFILCWLPFFSWYTPQHICGAACDKMIPDWAVTILFWIGYFNSTLNPIIYAYFNHEFRDAFKKTLQWIFCCCQDLKCLRVNRPNDNQHYNCTYRSTQEIGLVSNAMQSQQHSQYSHTD